MPRWLCALTVICAVALTAAPVDTAKDRDAAGDKEKPADKEKGEQPSAKGDPYWRGRLATLQTQLERDQTYLDAVQTRINSLTNDFLSRDDPAQRAVIQRERQRNLDELERLKTAIKSDKKAIA